MITKETVIDKIEILESGVIQIREITRIIEDEKIISSSITNKKCLNPDIDIEKIEQQDTKVKEVVALFHTKEVKEKFIQEKIKGLEKSNKGAFSNEIKKLQDKLKMTKGVEDAKKN
jgi:hypothetical protein